MPISRGRRTAAGPAQSQLENINNLIARQRQHKHDFLNLCSLYLSTECLRVGTYFFLYRLSISICTGVTDPGEDTPDLDPTVKKKTRSGSNPRKRPVCRYELIEYSWYLYTQRDFESWCPGGIRIRQNHPDSDLYPWFDDAGVQFWEEGAGIVRQLLHRGWG